MGYQRDGEVIIADINHCQAHPVMAIEPLVYGVFQDLGRGFDGEYDGYIEAFPFDYRTDAIHMLPEPDARPGGQ